VCVPDELWALGGIVGLCLGIKAVVAVTTLEALDPTNVLLGAFLIAPETVPPDSAFRDQHRQSPLLSKRTYDIFRLPSISYVRKRAMGRKKEYPERITLPLTTETVEKIDDDRGEEDRVSWIRDAIERKLKRRKA
jgi:hypothetical protein